MRNNKTFGEHWEYLQEIVKLKLCFLWKWLKEHPEENVPFVLRNRVDIYRKTDLNTEGINPTTVDFDDPRWLDFEDQISNLYKLHRYDSAPTFFEQKAFEILKDSIQRRASHDFIDHSHLEKYDCGSLRFDPPSEKRDPLMANFHVANMIAPRSIFDDPQYLPNCFCQMMEKAEQQYGMKYLGTFTWLNSCSRWLALFPKEWYDNLESECNNIQWDYSYWGQFIDARGGFNRRNATIFRQTNKFPFLPRASKCSFTAMRSHLANFLKSRDNN